MTPVALIVEYETPDLLALCLASLRRFAPEVTPIVLRGGPGAEYHARAIEAWRAQARDAGSDGIWPRIEGDPVILLDTDTVILSEHWWPTLEKAFSAGHDLVGGHRSRGEACQMFSGVTPLLHASMLAMTRRLFDAIVTFAADPVHPVLEVVVRDTAANVSTWAERPKVLPYAPVTAGLVFPGLQVGEYYDPASGISLWSHLWRGTGMPAGPPWRRALRVMRAACGSQSAKTMLRAEERKRAWMARAWEVVTA